jgi:hypothetical protein
VCQADASAANINDLVDCGFWPDGDDVSPAPSFVKESADHLLNEVGSWAACCPEERKDCVEARELRIEDEIGLYSYHPDHQPCPNKVCHTSVLLGLHIRNAVQRFYKKRQIINILQGKQ